MPSSDPSASRCPCLLKLLSDLCQISGPHHGFVVPLRGVVGTRSSELCKAPYAIVSTAASSRRNRRRSTLIASRSPAQRPAKAASASCDSASDRNVASVSSRPCQRTAARSSFSGFCSARRSRYARAAPERRRSELAERHLGGPEALLDRAGEMRRHGTRTLPGVALPRGRAAAHPLHRTAYDEDRRGPVRNRGAREARPRRLESSRRLDKSLVLLFCLTRREEPQRDGSRDRRRDAKLRSDRRLRWAWHGLGCRSDCWHRERGDSCSGRGRGASRVSRWLDPSRRWRESRHLGEGAQREAVCLPTPTGSVFATTRIPYGFMCPWSRFGDGACGEKQDAVGRAPHIRGAGDRNEWIHRSSQSDAPRSGSFAARTDGGTEPELLLPRLHGGTGDSQLFVVDGDELLVVDKPKPPDVEPRSRALHRHHRLEHHHNPCRASVEHHLHRSRPDGDSDRRADLGRTGAPVPTELELGGRYHAVERPGHRSLR